MGQSQDTRTSLILRIRNAQDDSAWQQFVEIYTPLIYGYGRKHGLQDADAVDLAQDVLHAVARYVGGFDYDPKRGSFRGWLLKITQNKLRNRHASEKNRVQATGNSHVKQMLNDHPDAQSDQQEWDRDYEQQMFAWASEQVRSEFQEATWNAFWQTSVEDRPAKAVAEQLGISVGAVYIAKSRVIARLREKVGEVTGE